MSNHMRIWMVGIVALIGCGVGTSVARGQDKDAKPAEAKPAEAKPIELSIEKFTPKHCTGAQVRILAATLAQLKKPAKTTLRLVVDEGSGSVIARGTAEELTCVAECLKLLDVPAEQLKTVKIQNVHLVPVPSDVAERVDQMLQDLGFQAKGNVALGKANVFIFADDTKETADLIKIVETIRSEKADKPATAGR